jgi:hypothetical protein
MDAGQQLTRIEGFGQVIVGTHFQSDNAVYFIALGSQHDDRRQVTLTTQPSADRQAVFTGHHQVKHDQVVVFPAAYLVHLLGVTHSLDGKALFAKVAGKKVA